MFNLVLIEPEIPQNTGNIGRSVLSLNAKLHLVKPLGFSLDDKSLRRAGLDYWKHLNIVVWENTASFFSSITPGKNIYFFSTRGNIRYDMANYKKGDYLIFGPESQGLSPEIVDQNPDRCCYIPISNLHVRSLNLSSAATVVLFEAFRQHNFFHNSSDRI